MSDALIKVIEQQQKEIDGLKLVIDSNQRVIAQYAKREKELFSLADKVFDVNVKPVNDDEKDDYLKARQSMGIYMMTHGWCFSCGGFECECYDE